MSSLEFRSRHFSFSGRLQASDFHHAVAGGDQEAVSIDQLARLVTPGRLIGHSRFLDGQPHWWFLVTDR